MGVNDEPEGWREEGSPEERMRRARAAIDRNVEELLAKAEAVREAHIPPSSPHFSDTRAGPAVNPHVEGSKLIGRQVSEAAEEIEARVRGVVSARLDAAERRLQLQAQALEAALGAEASQARLETGRLEEVRAALDDEVENRKSALLQEAEEGVQEIVEEVRLELDRSVSERTAELDGRLKDLRLELAATGRIAAERAASASAGIEALAAQLRLELEDMRSEISRRAIRRERKRLQQEGDAQASALSDLHETKWTESAEQLQRETTAQLERISAEIDSGIEAALARLEREHAGMLARLERETSRRGEEAVSAEIARRAGEVERQLEDLNRRLTGEASAGIEAIEQAAELRLAAAERAQEREEEVNRRIQVARLEAEGRVRGAERRLVEVMGQLTGLEK